VDEIPGKRLRICDPGAGHGILSCALVERLVNLGAEEIFIDVFEVDKTILSLLESNLTYLREFYSKQSIVIKFRVFNENFLIWANKNYLELRESYDYVISNPPYFKLNKGDENIQAVSFLLEGVTNIYAGFIAMGIKLTKISGETIFIVPRSFSSGLYFKKLRQFFFRETRLKHVHLFQSRTEAFKEDKVLQETLIFKANNREGVRTKITTSEGIKDLGFTCKSFNYNISELIELDSDHKILHLPTSQEDYEVIKMLKTLKYRLIDHQIKVSTGRVVAFRSKNNLKTDNADNRYVPLIWNFNVKKYSINWPVIQDKKPQYIDRGNNKILVPCQNYVVQRRFSAKEDKSRIVCAPFVGKEYKCVEVGFENKTNFMYKLGGEMSIDLVYGLCVLFNSSIYDRYFRIINGNINVSATEMANMPIPCLQIINYLGAMYIENENIVFNEELIKTILFSGKAEKIIS
jgi:adenine-specific DNA-methyltransferase